MRGFPFLQRKWLFFTIKEVDPNAKRFPQKHEPGLHVRMEKLPILASLLHMLTTLQFESFDNQEHTYGGNGSAHEEDDRGQNLLTSHCIHSTTNQLFNRLITNNKSNQNSFKWKEKTTLRNTLHSKTNSTMPSKNLSTNISLPIWNTIMTSIKILWGATPGT